MRLRLHLSTRVRAAIMPSPHQMPPERKVVEIKIKNLTRHVYDEIGCLGSLVD